MIYLLHGPDGYSVEETARRLLREAVPAEMADLNTTRLAAADVTLEGLRFACEALPFLADRRAVVVEQLFARLNSRRGRGAAGKGGDKDGTTEGPAEQERGLAAEIAAYLPRVPKETLLLFVEAEAPPKTGALAKALEQASAKQQFFPTLAGMPLVRWIKERARTAGGAISDAAAAVLADFVGGDLRTLSHEIAKLVTYAGPGRTVEADDVRLLVNQANEANVFEFVDAIGQGNRRRALASLHSLVEQGERAERILAMVSRQVRLLLQARDLTQRGEPADAVGRALGLSPFPLRKILEQSRLFQIGQLLAMHRRVLDCDVQIKTGQQDPLLALELLVTVLASQAGRATARVERMPARR